MIYKLLHVCKRLFKVKYMQTEKEKLDYINKECGTNYTSLDKVDWCMFSKKQKLSEDFIREFRDKVKWSIISHYQKLSESFIREFQDKVDWYYISSCQELTDEFKKEFKNEVDWYFTSEYQDKKIFENTDECNITYEPNEDTTTFDNFRNITLTEKELLDKVDNRDLPQIINKIQNLKSLITKLTQDIDNYDFTNLELKYMGNDKTISDECNDDIIDFDNDMFTSEELRLFMINIINFYECKLHELEKQYLDIFYGDKYKTLTTK